MATSSATASPAASSSPHINTMSVLPTTSYPTAAHLAPPLLLLSASPSCKTIRTSDAPLTEPPSYLSPAVRALKHGYSYSYTCTSSTSASLLSASNTPPSFSYEEDWLLTPPRNARTRGPFKPRSAAKGTSSYQLRQFAEATLGSGSLRKAVKLPEGEDENEWLAVNGEMAYFAYGVLS